MFVALMMGTACMIFLTEFKLHFHPTTAIGLTILIVGVSLDFLTTYLCLRVSGKEGNPVIAFLMRKITVFGTFGLMALLWVVFIELRFLHSDVYSQFAIACTYWLVPGNNILVLRKLILRKRATVPVQN